MDKPILKKVDILVYPFHGLNKALETPYGISKFLQWTKQVEYAAKNKDTAFIVVHDSFSKEDAFRDKFNSFLKKNLGGNFVSFDSGVGGLTKKELVDFFGMVERNFLLGPKVELRRFGQYVPDASVEKVGAPISAQLGKVFKSVGVLTLEREVSGLSIKQPDAYFAKLVSKKLKGNVKFGEELLLRVLSNSLRSSGKLNPASVAHAIKRSSSVSDVHKNFELIKKRFK